VFNDSAWVWMVRPASGGSAAPGVVDRSRSRGLAVANGSNIADGDQSATDCDSVETFRGLAVLVNNAGIVRDRMMAIQRAEFDTVHRRAPKATSPRCRQPARRIGVGYPSEENR